MKNKKNVLITIGLVILVVGLIALVWYSTRPKPVSVEIEKLSLCLKEKSATMYGTYWCPHCINQKKAFGSSFKNIPYVECTEKEKECTAAGVVGYPTWIFADGTKLSGVQEFKTLAEKAGCPFSIKN